MKRALLWIGVMVLIGAVEGLVRHEQVLFFSAAIASVIWLLVGIAWGARGVVRYLKR